MYLSCLSGLWWLLSIEFTSHRLSPEWLRHFCSFESCLYLSYTSCLIFLSLMCGNEIDWDFLYSSVHEYEIVDSVVFSKSVALHKSNSWMDALPSLLFFLHWLRSYPSWCFLRGRWEPILFSMDFLWKLFLQAACAQLRDFFSRFQRHLFSIFGYTSSCFAASVCSCNTSLGGFIVFASSFQMQTCPVLKGFLCGCVTN